MFHYQDSNKKVLYLFSGILFIAFGGISLHEFIEGNLISGFFVLAIVIFQFTFLWSLINTVRFDYTGLTRTWTYKRKVLHFPINQITKVIYKKRVFGGFSRKAYLEVYTPSQKELIALQTPRTEHFELLRLIHSCGIEIEFYIVAGHYTRKATQSEIDNLFNFT